MDSRKQSLNRLRLQKYLAQCGAGSRRASEGMIASGRITVNGQPILLQGTSVDPAHDIVRVDGRVVRQERKVYLLLNKPGDVLCTCRDPRNRRTFLDLLPRDLGRLYPVGRLDRESEGLLLVTNDGELAQALTHPRHAVVRRYRVRINGVLDRRQTEAFREGIESEGETLRADDVQPAADGEAGAYEVVLREGRNRQIRRMFEALGYAVRSLRRTAMGSLTVTGVRSGRWRLLTPGELARLRRDAGLPPTQAPRAEARKSTRTGPRSAGDVGRHAPGMRETRAVRGSPPGTGQARGRSPSQRRSNERLMQRTGGRASSRAGPVQAGCVG